MLRYAALQGKWAPRKIPNPDFYTDDNPLSGIGQVRPGGQDWSWSTACLLPPGTNSLKSHAEMLNEWCRPWLSWSAQTVQ